MTTCREPNGCITQVQILILKGRSYSFRRDNHLSYRKESWGCNIQLGTEVSNWLHQRLWKDHHLQLAERIPLHSRGAKGTNIMRPLLTLRRVPVIRFRYDRPDQRRFSFCYATIKSRKQFAARNSHKGGTVALPLEQFYLTTELSNVVGISCIFVTSFGRYPCRRW